MRLAQGLVHEAPTAQRDLVEPRQRRAGDLAPRIHALHRPSIPVEVREHPVAGQRQALEGVADQRRRGLQLRLDRLGGALLREPVPPGKVVSARQDRDRRIERAHAPHREARPVGLGDRQDHQRGVLGLGSGQDDPLRRVAEHGGHASRAEALDDVRVGLDHDIRHAESLQRFADGAPDTAEAAQDDVAGERLSRAQAPHRSRRVGQARPSDPARDEPDERGVEQDRHEGRRERRVVYVGADVARLPRHLDQDEGEFADLGEPDAHEERGPQRLTEEKGDGGPDHPLAQDDEADERGQERDVRDDHARVDQGADRDEEEGDERVADRQEARERLVRVVRLVDEQPRQERAKRE